MSRYYKTIRDKLSEYLYMRTCNLDDKRIVAYNNYIVNPTKDNIYNLLIATSDLESHRQTVKQIYDLLHIE